MLDREKGVKSKVLITTSSIEQHGYKQRIGHPPTPAPDHLASGDSEIFEVQKSFKGPPDFFQLAPGMVNFAIRRGDLLPNCLLVTVTDPCQGGGTPLPKRRIRSFSQAEGTCVRAVPPTTTSR